MLQTTKAQQSQKNNLSNSKNHQKASVEDIPEPENGNPNEDLLEQGFFFLDNGSDSEEDGSEEEDEEDEDEEYFGPKDDTDIDQFNAILFTAQALAMKAECKAAGERAKWKWFYSGNISHHTLPPDMALKLKAEHVKKYGTLVDT